LSRSSAGAAPFSELVIRALQRGWTAGVVLAVLTPLGALVWTHVDRRPAWVMSVVVRAESRDETRSRDEERAAVAAVLGRVGRLHLGPVEVRGERERRIGDGLTYVAERTIVVRNEREEPLSALERDTGSPDGLSTTPRRALRAPDTAFGLVLLAMLLGMSTLERSALSDADPFALRPPIVLLNLLTLGLLGAGAAVVAGGWNALLGLSVAFALGPGIVWLARSRSYWRLDRRLSSRYLAIAFMTGAVVVAWLARLTVLPS
jgi:hypothetical protein